LWFWTQEGWMERFDDGKSKYFWEATKGENLSDIALGKNC